MKNRKLLLVGSSESVHLENYFHLIQDYFDEILVVSNSKVTYAESKILNFSLKKPWLLIGKVIKMKKILKDFEPSHIHVHQAGTYSYITALANKSRIPLYLTTWGSDVLLTPKKNFLYKHLVKFSLQKADFITADAQFMVDAIKQMVDTNVLIANFGIDYLKVEIPSKEKIIYCNRLHKSLYRVDSIIEGFCQFYAENPDWKLVIGANGVETDKLKELARTLLPESSYEFIGFVSQEENKKQYLRAKMWISYPVSDGTAISLLEAMGYGCIPVVSDLPANREWIEDQSNGVIISKTIKHALNSAKLLDNELVTKKNQEIIESKATKEVNRKKFVTLYDQKSR
ncbi:MAG: glycosyltransferase family 4 protein [Flavobacteriales bacterium]